MLKSLKRYWNLSLSILCINVIICTMFIASIPVDSISQSSGIATIASNVNSSSSSTLIKITDSPYTYEQYIKLHTQSVSISDPIVIKAEKYIEADETAKLIKNTTDEGSSLLVSSNGFCKFSVDVQQETLYNIKVEYYPYPDFGGEIVRSILIDGELPFSEASQLSFSRVWNDIGEIQQDSQNNDIRPRQVEIPEWQMKTLSDSLGYEQNSYRFYFQKGVHSISFNSISESWLIKSITLYQEKEALSYQEQLQKWTSDGAKSASQKIFVQAEKASAKSDQMMYPLNDRTSPSVSPYSYQYTRYNTIGSDRWTQVGQWLEWEITVKEAGLYNLGMHWKQSMKNNDVSSRKLLIDGTIPFAEAATLTFGYNNSWQYTKIGSTKSNPDEGYGFYLSEGVHTIRFEVVLGGYSSIIKQTNNAILQLNSVYREIVAITGSDPDIYRDYEFEKLIPDTLKKLQELSKDLRYIESEVVKLTTTGGQSTAIISQLYSQIDSMAEDSETIPQRLNSFQSNISSLGTWVNTASTQPLELDSIELMPLNTKTPAAENNFLGIAWHYIRQFISSFFTDYNSVGAATVDINEKLVVWLGAVGRDQAQIIQQQINDSFTPENGVGVDAQLVAPGSLLTATLAGIGPDLSLQMGQTEPMNYALRNAVYDLSNFDDLDKVLTRFDKSATIPFQLGESVYALPETQSYPMLFYRKDILDAMGISLDKLDTWSSILKGVLPQLQRNYLQFGMLPSLNSYAILLYQNGGSLYNESGTVSLLNSIESVESFEDYTNLYTNYKIPLSFDFANRFRSGEMPIAVVDFTAYNQLTVFAPEIKGLWGMRHVPGIESITGEIDYSVAASVSGCMMMVNAKNKENAWKFLKWWTSSDAQEMYGNSLESIMGAAARYPTANLAAQTKMKWSVEAKTELSYQTKWLKAIPELPGSYFTGRNFDFAFRDVVYSGLELRESLNDSVKAINAEITKKRKEFGLALK